MRGQSPVGITCELAECLGGVGVFHLLGMLAVDLLGRTPTKEDAADFANGRLAPLDGQKATIKLTENYPYVSQRDQAGNPTWSEKEVGPKLEFLPTIGRDGIVTVKLKISTGEIIGTYVGANKEEFPQTTNREVDTMVRVRDGEPFVVGGLFKDQKTKEVSKIPVLSDIPLLGQFFTARTSKNIKSELAMIVVPYILHTPDTSIEKTILK